MTPFANRTEAGKALAEVVASRSLPDPVVLALPRGGVPVAAEVARVLNAPLDLVMVRKIGVPWQPELAAAAVIDGKDAQIVVNEEVCAEANISRAQIDEMAKHELEEIERRAKLYLKDRPRVPIGGRSAIIVDDGIATGTTIRAVIKALRLKQPKSILLAVPVAPKEAVATLREEADDIVCLETPEPFWGISLHYVDFHQVGDLEVISILEAQEPKAAKPTEAKAKKLKKAKKAKKAKKGSDANPAAALLDQPA
jgi:putative phosphoribosyl transferase